MIRTFCYILALLTATPATMAAEEPTRAQALYEQASTLMSEGRLDEAQSAFDRAFALPDVESDEVYPLLLNEQATLLTWRGERGAAIAAKRAVIPMLDSFGDTELDVSVYSDLGLLYNRASRIDSATYFFELADSAARVLGDPGWQASVKQNIGVMYYNLKHFDTAAKYLREAADYGMEAADDYSIVSALQLLSIAQIEQNDTVQAGQNALAAWRQAVGSGNTSLKLRCIPSLYRYYEAVGKADSVDYYMAIGKDLYDQMPPNSVISQGYVMAAARMHFNRGEWAKALEWYGRQLKSPMYNDRATLYSQVAACYRNLGQWEKACIYLDSARIVTDSLAAAESAARLDEFNVKYGAMEREIENQELRLGVLQRERIILIITLIVVALGMGAIWLYRHQRRIRRDMEEMNRRRDLESAQNYIRGLEDERKYFAKELHDGIANDLLGLKMKIETGNGDRNTISHLVTSARDAVRRISHNLMPPEFESMTLSEVMKEYIAALDRDCPARVTFTYNGTGDLPPEKAREVYRVTQEYLMNLLRHGRATEIEVRLTSDTEGVVELQIFDNSPVTPPGAPASNGIGLRTMADRARSMNAIIDQETLSDGRNLFRFQFTLI